MELPIKLIERYRVALAAGAKHGPVSEKSLYELHAKALGHLETLFSSETSIEEIVSHILQERRSFGWSYLSGDYGKSAENAFQALAAEIERHIIIKKGRDLDHVTD